MTGNTIPPNDPQQRTTYQSSTPTFNIPSPSFPPSYPTTTQQQQSTSNPTKDETALIPPNRNFTYRTLINRPKVTSFTQEDIDNFLRHNARTINRTTVDRFVDHLYELLISAHDDPDAKTEAQALMILHKHLSHNTMATLIHTFLDTRCDLPEDRDKFWRRMKMQFIESWHRSAPPRYTLATSISQMSAVFNRIANTSNNTTNTNNNRNQNNNRPFNNNNNPNFNNNRNFNNNNNRNLANQRFNNNNNRNFRFVRFVKNDNQSNNNRLQQHTSVQNSNFNTNRNNNNNSTNNNNNSRPNNNNNNNNQRNTNNNNNRSNTNPFRANNLAMEDLTDQEIQMYYDGNLPDDSNIFAIPLNDDSQDYNDNDGNIHVYEDANNDELPTEHESPFQ